MFKVVTGLVIVSVIYFGWKFCSRTAYETAAYTVISKDGEFEIREYPDLILVSTTMRNTSGRDGSFMRLFRYIGGSNESKTKIAMTTPVFMDPESKGASRQMAFVLPSKIDLVDAPQPEQDSVSLAKRSAGKYAVIRFSGVLSESTADAAEKKLRLWLSQQGIEATQDMEMAGYDPPITPGFLRRNEVLVKLE